MGFATTKVGFAHHARVFKKKKKCNLWHRLCACLASRMFQDAITRACLVGRFIFPIKKIGDVRPGVYADFLGLNYYTRSTVSSLADGSRENSPKNDLDWEIYPEGIVKSAQDLYKLLEKPIYITENGTCDNNDNFRSLYIYDHLKELINSGLPVERYYHWSFTDNFEWCEGESARFGLVHVDYETQKRTIKKSGQFYSAMIKNKNVTDEMYKEFIAGQSYNIR
jgi:beta-glucosidase